MIDANDDAWLSDSNLVISQVWLAFRRTTCELSLDKATKNLSRILSRSVHRELEARRLQLSIGEFKPGATHPIETYFDPKKCDGNHGGQPCNDKECWQR